MALHDYKNMGQKLHQEFHNNVHLLTLIYPPSKKFESVFKENMFTKSNKAGFHEVVYYLLNIIEPEKIKQKVPSWPIVESRMEHLFRNEVLKYINDLKQQYDDACLPTIATSHLISPGGVKFIKFMVKLSVFVLYVHVKESGKFSSSVLFPVRSTAAKSVTSEHLKKLNTYSNHISTETEQLKYFADMQEVAKKEALVIIEKQEQARKVCKQYEAKLKILQMEASSDSGNELYVHCKKMLDSLVNIKDRMYKCQELSNYLSTNENEIEYKKDVDHQEDFEDEHENLDLVKLMESYHQAIKNQQFEIQPLDTEFVISQIERFQELNQKLSIVRDNLEQLQPDLTKLSTKIQKITLNDVPKIEKDLFPAMESTRNDADSASVC